MNKFRIILAVLMSVAMITLSACGNDGSQSSAAANDTPPADAEEQPDAEPEQPAEADGEDAEEEGEEPAAAGDSAAPAGEFSGKLQGPFIVTSCGQSPGAVMVDMVATQAGISSTNDNGLSAADFSAGDAKTLIVTTGTSGKGMGAAGTDVDAEIARCVELIGAARSAGLTICCAHVEGMARRTDSSDQASIDAIIALADVVLVIDESDSDGLFTDYTTANNIPLLKVEDSLSIGDVME